MAGHDESPQQTADSERACDAKADAAADDGCATNAARREHHGIFILR